MIPLYREIENSLLDILITIKDRLEILDATPNLLKKIEDSISFINSKRYQVAVVGAFKTGKSSLINALLGYQNLLPEDIIPATATINRVVFGKTKSAKAFFYDGKSEDIPLNELSKYVAKTTPDGEYQASLIKEVAISMPTVICQNHVEIIDTPGLNDDEKMTAITLRAVDEVDAVILTMSQQFQFDEYISKFVCELIKKDSITNIVFVVTHIDELYETLEDEGTTYDEFIVFLKNQIKNKVFDKLQGEEEYLEKAHRLLDLDRIQLFGISSYFYFEYLKRKESESTGLLEKSRFENFNNELIPIITAQQIENTIIKTKVSIEKIIEECSSLQIQKETFFESQKNNNDYIRQLLENNIENLVCKSFNEVYCNHYIEYDDCIMELNKEKNTIAKEFLNQIITIKINDKNEEIQQRLIQKFTEIEKKEREEVFGTLKEKIISINKSIYQDFIDKNKGLFLPLIEDASNVFNFSFFESFLYNEDFIKGHLSFQWNNCPITKNTDCFHTDLMELFIEAIDISMEESKKSLKKYYNKELPEKATNILKKGLSDNIKELETKIDKEKSRIEEEKITFKNNFIEFSEKIPELKDRLDILTKKYMENIR